MEKITKLPYGPGWGLYDVEDKCWLGNDIGPLNYGEDQETARLAATVATQMFGRFISATYRSEPANKLKDVVTPPIDAVEAIKQIEKGR